MKNYKYKDLKTLQEDVSNIYPLNNCFPEKGLSMDITVHLSESDMEMIQEDLRKVAWNSGSHDITHIIGPHGISMNLVTWFSNEI